MTTEEFKIYFPEFEDTSEGYISRAYDMSLNMTDEIALGDKYELSIMYLTAHYLVLSIRQLDGNTSSAGKIQSKSVDGVSITYADDGSNGNQYMNLLSTTSYGQMYLSLTSFVGAGGFSC